MADLAILAETLRGGVAGEFAVEPYYEPVFDSLICYLRDTRCIAERLNEVLTVYLDNERSLVGFEIKGIRRLIEHDGFLDQYLTSAEAADGKICVARLVLMGLGPLPTDPILANHVKSQLSVMSKTIGKITFDRRQLRDDTERVLA